MQAVWGAAGPPSGEREGRRPLAALTSAQRQQRGARGAQLARKVVMPRSSESRCGLFRSTLYCEHEKRKERKLMYSYRARGSRALIALCLLVQLLAVSSLLAATPPADFSDTLVTSLASPTLCRARAFGVTPSECCALPRRENHTDLRS